jgi:hypothetical protein
MPRSHAVNRVQQQEHKERKDAEKATRKRREERRKAHNLVWVQREKEGLSLSTTPEDTDSNNDGGVVWSELEEGSEDEVPLAAWAKGKNVVQVRVAAAPQRAQLRLARALRWWVCPARGAHRRRRPQKTQASGVDPMVSSIVVVCVLPNFVPSSS